MKNLARILILVFAFTLTTQAQEKNYADKMLKKLTKDLNLTEAQQSEIKPLLEAQIAKRKEMKEKIDSGERPSKEMRKKMRADREANQTAMNTKMASILDEEQYAKYEAMLKDLKQKVKNRKEKN